jgi:hypothetical protein
LQIFEKQEKKIINKNLNFMKNTSATSTPAYLVEELDMYYDPFLFPVLSFF